MPITNTWIGGTGDWDIATNWSANAKPDTLDGAVFSSTAVATLTNVEFENIASLLLSAAAATVNVQGELTVGGAHLNGVTSTIDVNAGSLTVDGGGLIAGQFVTEASGTVHVTHGGTYQWNGSGSTQNVDLGKSVNDTFQFSTQFGGTVSNFFSGDIISYSGAVNSVVIGNNTVTFNAANNQTYVLNLSGGPYNSNNLSASGNVLETTLLPPVTINTSFPTGYALQDGVQKLTIGSAAVVGGSGVTTAPDHPVDIINSGAVSGTPAGMTLADGGSVTNGSKTNHTASISGGKGIVFQGAAGTVNNFGTITGTGGTAISFVSGQPNKLIEQGTGVLNGTVSGGGGTLELGAQGGAGTMSGLGTSLKGFGTVTVEKGAAWTLSGTSTVAATTVLSNSGTLTLSGAITNSGQVNNLVGATLDFGGDYNIGNTGSFSNAGIVEKLSGTGTSIIRTGAASLTSTGTIDVETGTLELTGSTVTITGSIKGAGTIEFGPGATTLGAGSAITTAALTIAGTGAHVTVGRNLVYASAFSAGATTDLSVAATDLFQLTGTASFTHDTVDGAGRLMTEGTTTVNMVTLGGTAQWYNAGTITETGTLIVGDTAGNAAKFVNQATGVLDLAGNVGIGIGTAATSTFTNQGLVAKTAGSLSTVSIAMANTGTIESASGTLDLQKAVTGTGGILKIDAGKILHADAAVSAGQTVTFGQGGDKLVLTDAADFAARLSGFTVGDKLDLREFDLTTTTLGFAENAAMTQGTLTVTDGALVAKIILLGQYSAAQFHKSSDGVGGTYITDPPLASPTLIAAAHH
jgi:hypothetical protein